MASQPKLASPAQIKYIEDLCRQRILSPEAARRVAERLTDTEPLTSGLAHTMIEFLKELPLKPGQKRTGKITLPDVPAGHYAAMEDDTIKFFRVDRPTEGKWQGYTFLKLQHGPNYEDVRNMGRVKIVLDAISSNVEGSARLYGQQIGVCGICSLPLTNEVSRRNGIGPICAGKHGITYDANATEDIPVDAPVILSDRPSTAAQAIREPQPVQTTTPHVGQPTAAASTNRRGGVKAPASFADLKALRKEQ